MVAHFLGMVRSFEMQCSSSNSNNNNNNNNKHDNVYGAVIMAEPLRDYMSYGMNYLNHYIYY